MTSGSAQSALALPNLSVLPASTVTSPVRVLRPVKVSVPVPSVVRATRPAPSSITPEKVVDWPVVSTLKVTGPVALEVISPSPDKPFTVAL